MTLESSIYHFSIITPNKVAAICGDKQITYATLWESIVRKSKDLKEHGLKAYQPYVFRATQDIDFVITYCAIHYLNAIAVPLENKVTEENFIFISNEVKSYSYDKNIVDILYTTGTTGKSKGVMLSEEALESCADNFINDLHFSSDLLFILTGPLNHIATLFKMHPVLTVGGTICILDGLKDLKAFFDVFNLPFSKFATFLVPASIRLIMQFSYDDLCSLADKIDFIETGAAPITKSDMTLLSKALPNSRLYNTYGGTEIGAVCTYNFNDGKYIEGCIGKPMKNSSLEITSEGNIIVSGPTIMSGYVGDIESTQKVLRNNKIYGSDLGYVDDNGMIHLTGRQGDVINIGGYKVDPTEVENVVMSYNSIKDCICISSEHPVIGTVLKLLVVLADDVQLDKRLLSSYLKSKLDPYKVPFYYDVVESIQRTYNGKLDRKYYKNN